MNKIIIFIISMLTLLVLVGCTTTKSIYIQQWPDAYVTNMKTNETWKIHPTGDFILKDNMVFSKPKDCFYKDPDDLKNKTKVCKTNEYCVVEKLGDDLIPKCYLR